MNWRREPCRNFQRGSCRYGENCKFLHETQPQQNSNAFRLSTGSSPQSWNASQQNKPPKQPNPFGFGTGIMNQQQMQHQQPRAHGFGTNQRSGDQKPFENKWTRSVNSSPVKHEEPRTVNHRCEDPNACKQLIVEDLTNERPLWMLTCYGHFKGLPCDIYGDTSLEELRYAAYEDAKRGLSLQSIVQRERDLLNSKLLEFDKLLRNPYVILHTRSAAAGSPFSNKNVLPFIAQGGNASQSFGDSHLRENGEAEQMDASIWLKEKWRPKEIPEIEPPPRYCLD